MESMESHNHLWNSTEFQLNSVISMKCYPYRLNWINKISQTNLIWIFIQFWLQHRFFGQVFYPVLFEILGQGVSDTKLSSLVFLSIFRKRLFRPCRTPKLDKFCFRQSWIKYFAPNMSDRQFIQINWCLTYPSKVTGMISWQAHF